jgi:RNA polymerase sigma-70 factor, ECF subfamily
MAMEHGDQRSDAEVVGRSRADPESFGALFERHARGVHGYLSRRAGRQTADELLGEVFTVAFTVRVRYDPAYPDARPWLYGIARNVLSTRLRGEDRRAAATARLPADGVAHPWPEVDDRLAAAAEGAQARRLLAKLPDGEREVVELVAWEQLDPTEAAAVLGIPAGTARSRLHRARARLREALDTPQPDTLSGGQR